MGWLRFAPPLAHVLIVSVVAAMSWLALKNDPPSVALEPTTASMTAGAMHPKTGQPTVTSADPTTADLSEISARPLFENGRRQPIKEEPEVVAEVPRAPPKEIEEVEVPAPETPPKISYLGFLDDGQSRKALVVVEGAADQRWAEVGDMMQDWMITEINGAEIRLRKGDTEITVKMLE